jgi:atypical dual specificity phosphatase
LLGSKNFEENNFKKYLMRRKQILLKEFGPRNVISDNDFPVAVAIMAMTLRDGTPLFIPGFEYLSIGSIGSAYNPELISKFSISHVICLTELSQLKFQEQIKYLSFDFHDSSEEKIDNILASCVDFIEQAIEVGGKILIHCYQGKSRSVAICCAYLMVKYQLTMEHTLSLIRTVRPMAQPNRNFCNQLKLLEQSLIYWFEPT